MTDTHRHSWRWHSDHGEDGIDCRICAEAGYSPDNWMRADEVIRRLNAMEELWELMAFLQAEDGPNEMGGPFVAVSVIAARLEGDDE